VGIISGRIAKMFWVRSSAFKSVTGDHEQGRNREGRNSERGAGRKRGTALIASGPRAERLVA
jgi:hypothetical protein